MSDLSNRFVLTLRDRAPRILPGVYAWIEFGSVSLKLSGADLLALTMLGQRHQSLNACPTAFKGCESLNGCPFSKHQLRDRNSNEGKGRAHIRVGMLHRIRKSGRTVEASASYYEVDSFGSRQSFRSIRGVGEGSARYKDRVEPGLQLSRDSEVVHGNSQDNRICRQELPQRSLRRTSRQPLLLRKHVGHDGRWVRTRHRPEVHVRNMVSYQVAIDDRHRRILTFEPFHNLSTEETAYGVGWRDSRIDVQYVHRFSPKFANPLNSAFCCHCSRSAGDASHVSRPFQGDLAIRKSVPVSPCPQTVAGCPRMLFLHSTYTWSIESSKSLPRVTPS